MKLKDKDIKELFALLTSSTDYERNQIYDVNNAHFYESVTLHEIYDLSQEKREYAFDAWRAVIYYLYKHGYRLTRENTEIKLDFIEKEFIG